uniref:Uncharacterized protein n=1 Tax=Photinus pyralis TaxID=7054 RepID=A0A1Y1ML03_PHOPY
MNKLVIPPSPNWFANNVLACASDNTVVYGSRNEIVVIKPAPPEEPADVQVLSGIHSTRVTFVSLNTNWGNPNKWAVSVAEDNVVQLLDIATCTPKISHVGHKTHPHRLIGAVFCGEDKVVSVSEHGIIIVWKLSTNSLTPIHTMKGMYVKVSTLSSCPHAPWIVAFGLKKGGIIVMDMKKMGKVLFKIHAHDDEVISLSWCPTPFNIFPKNIRKITVVKEVSSSSEANLSKIKEPAHDTESTEISVTTDESTVTNQIPPIDSESIETEAFCLGNHESLEDEDPIINTSADEITEIKNVEVENVQQSHGASETVIKVDKEEECVKESTESSNDCKHVQSEPENIETDCDSKISHDLLLSTNDNESCKLATPTNSPRTGDIIKIDIVSDVLLQEKVEDNFLEDSSTLCQLAATCEDTPLRKCTVAIDSDQNSFSQERPEDQPTDIQFGNENSNSINEESTVIDSSLPERVDDLSLKTATEPELSAPKQEFLLASYARGSRSIKIWRAGSNGLLQTEVFPPNQPYPKRSNKYHHDKAWLSVCWVTPTQLLSSSSKGQLLLWELNEVKEGTSGKRNYHYRVIHADHSKYVFCIAAPVRNYPPIDASGGAGDMGELNAWTIGNDRFILNTSLGTGFSNLVTYSTTGGAVTCLVPSSITPSRIACGFSDGNHKMWDLSQPHLQRVILNPIFDKHTIKVTSFAWHPTKEDCLAYGTIDGYIGLIDASSLSKNFTQLVQSSAATVCHLQWGPLDTDTIGLYTVANGKLVVYNVKHPLHEPAAIEFDVDYNLTSFSWKPDYSIIAIATKNFELLLYSNKFKLLNTFLLQSKIVRCLAWHPSDTTEKNWLAISSNQVIVYDCTEKDTEGSSKYDKCAIAIFSQHKGTVQCLSWSPHQSGILASACDDGSALVWNVKSQTLLHACHCYSDVLSSVVWSPFDADYLITGGKACTIRIWKLSENPPVLRPEKPSANPALTLNGDKDDTTENSIVAKTESKPRRTTKQFLNGIARIHNVNNHSELLQNCLTLFSLRSRSSDNVKSYKHELDKESEFNVGNLFGDKDGIAKILLLERENHLNRTTPLSLESVSLWEGNIDETIKNAIKCGSLNPWLIGIAPMVSHSLWQQACESYAKQLLNSANNKPVEASFYYLACHKVEEAIEALCSGSYYREALILAKTRLSNSDPIINNVIERWAKYAASVGCYEVAAQCYLALDKLEEATKVLFRRTDIPTLEFCVTLAKESGNEDMLHATLFRLNSFKSEFSDKVEDPAPPLPTRLEAESSHISCDIKIAEMAENKTENGDEITSDNTIVA